MAVIYDTLKIKGCDGGMGARSEGCNRVRARIQSNPAFRFSGFVQAQVVVNCFWSQDTGEECADGLNCIQRPVPANTYQAIERKAGYGAGCLGNKRLVLRVNIMPRCADDGPTPGWIEFRDNREARIEGDMGGGWSDQPLESIEESDNFDLFNIRLGDEAMQGGVESRCVATCG